MVKSTVVGITPAAHGASHIHGGSDPVTGDVRINRLAVFDGTTIHNGAMTAAAWTVIDLSATVGTQRTLVHLISRTNGANAQILAFRTPDYGYNSYNATHAGAGASAIYGAAVQYDGGDAFVVTDANGHIEYWAGNVNSMRIFLMEYTILEP